MASVLGLDARLFERVLVSLVDGVAVVDANDLVAYWNPSLEKLFNLSAGGMLGMSLPAAIEKIAARMITSEDAARRLSGAFAHPELAQPIDSQTASEPSIAISINVFPILDENGSQKGCGMLARDVTRERRADALKSQLLATVSHELRTPLASIKGFATTLLRQDVSWSMAEQQDFLRIIEDETDRLSEIIDNLLDMSQIEAGALRIDREPTQLRGIIRELVDQIRMRTEAHYFVLNLPNELPRVYADARRMRQVIRNLLDNAIKYSKSGQITVACQVEGIHLLVSVSDQGDGIPPEYLSQVFDRFFQVDGKSTRKKGGSGLGLSISRGIVEAHGGRMWVESALGQGSAFKFTVPLATAD
jgi:signal transduction histidine kinase